MRSRRLGLDPGDRPVGTVRLQAIDAGGETGRGQHQQVVRTVHRQVDRIERVAAHHLQPLVLRPAVDALEDPVNEVQRAFRVDRASTEGLEAIRYPLHLGALRERRRSKRCGGPGDIEAREFTFTLGHTVRHVFDRVRVGILVYAQESGAVVAVARRITTLRIDVEIAEMNVVHVVEAHRIGRGAQRTGHAIPVVVRDQDVMRIADFERDGVAALAVLLLGLGGEQLPVRNMVEDDFVAHVMLDRHLVHVARRAGVGDIQTRAGVGVRAPAAIECATAAVCDPQAGILAIPTPRGIAIGAVVRVVGIEARSVLELGAVTALELDVVDEGILTGAP